MLAKGIGADCPEAAGVRAPAGRRGGGPAAVVQDSRLMRALVTEIGTKCKPRCLETNGGLGVPHPRTQHLYCTAPACRRLDRLFQAGYS